MDVTVAVCAVSHDRRDQVQEMIESARAEGVYDIVALDVATEPLGD